MTKNEWSLSLRVSIEIVSKGQKYLIFLLKWTEQDRTNGGTVGHLTHQVQYSLNLHPVLRLSHLLVNIISLTLATIMHYLYIGHWASICRL